MHELTRLIFDDMKPALGVTEPGAIAWAVASARAYLQGPVEEISLYLNSGMYKNAYTCGIPGSAHLGNVWAAALGAVAARPEKGLECLDGVTEEDNKKAETLVKEGRIRVHMTEISSRIFIKAEVITEGGRASVTIRDTHTGVTEIQVNGETIFHKEAKGETDSEESGETPGIHRWSLDEMFRYVSETDYRELQGLLEAHEMNYRLFMEGLESPRTVFAPYFFKRNGSVIFSEDARKTAALLCAGAIEARVMGLDCPAMSITGSGAHGILAVLPLFAEARVNGLPDESLARATALSYLVCMYIKEYSGRLSAFCGCGIAAGTGAACGLVYLKGGGLGEISLCIRNMASGITGMICDGGNQGCVMKGITAVDCAFQAAELAVSGIAVDPVHGINGKTPEETMEHMGRIASPGMTGTEKTIIEIMEEKG